MTSTVSLAAPVTVRQYSRPATLLIWAAAALPMAVLAWIAVPVIAGRGAPDGRFATTLIGALTAGLVWQCVLALVLVFNEQRTLRWSVLREALWLRAPSRPGGRRGGRLWLWLVPFVLGDAVVQLIPFGMPAPVRRDFGEFLGSAGGRDLLRGNWALFVLIMVMFLFNTVLGEELLFRGLLLPRMRAAWGDADWVVNGLLFGLYHLSQPWTIPNSILCGTFVYAYPTKRFRSAWLGIAVHSAQSVFFTVIILGLVIS